VSDCGTDYLRLPAFAADDVVHLVIETPRGAQTKLKYDTQSRTFRYSRPLAMGLTYPFDWGFVPSTLAPDGDPLDGFAVHASTWPGTIIPCCLLGVLEVEQTEKGKKTRNDRLAFRPAADPHHRRDTSILCDRTQRELEQFFSGAVLGTGKELRFLGWKCADDALAIAKQCVRAFAKADGWAV
jgi:inorganic pyrophosphatase